MKKLYYQVPIPAIMLEWELWCFSLKKRKMIFQIVYYLHSPLITNMDSTLAKALRYANKQHAEMTKLIMAQQSEIENLVDELDAERVSYTELENESKRVALERDELAKQIADLTKERDELKRQLTVSSGKFVFGTAVASTGKFDFSKPNL